MKSILRVSLAALVLFPVHLRADGPEDYLQFAKDIVIEPGQSASDAVCFLCSIRVRGTLEGDALAIGGGLEVEGTIEGDALVAGGGVRLGPGAKISGDVLAAGGKVERSPGAQVEGDFASTRWFHFPGQRRVFLFGSVGILGLNLALVLVCYALLRRRRLEVMAGLLRSSLRIAIATGAGIMVIGFFLLFMSAFMGRFVAIWAVLILGLWLVIFVLGYSATTYGLGALFPSHYGPLIKALAGIASITLLELIPFAGFFAFALASLLAMGIPVVSGLGKASDWLPQRFQRRALTSPPV